MQLKIFDVVELKDKTKATILDIKDNEIKAEVLDCKGKRIGIKNIKIEDIAEVIYKH